MRKTQVQEKNSAVNKEVVDYTNCVERELEYWLKEKRASYIERSIKAANINTGFAGAITLDMLQSCGHPDESETMDMMYEEDEDFIYDMINNIDFEEVE